MITETTRLYSTTIGALKQHEKDALAIKHYKKASAFFRTQKGMVLSELGKHQYLFSESYRKLAEESPVQLTAQNWDRIWEELSRLSNPELEELVAAAEADGLIHGAQQLKRLFNVDTTFNLANPRAVAWFQLHGGSVHRIAGIQRTTGDQIRTIITNSINKGWSYNQTAKEISGKFDGFSRERAKRIAITETGNSYEEGNRLFADSMEDDGIHIEKYWQTSEDDRVSDGCQENQDAGWIGLNEYFPSGHQQPLRFPGCRCYCIYREASVTA